MNQRDPFGPITRYLGVTGGRKYKNPLFVQAMLDAYQPHMIIHGGAEGADTFADDWAKAHGVPRAIFAIPKHFWQLYGLGCGHRRNEQMRWFSHAIVPPPWEGEWTIEWMAFPGGNGTNGMVGLCEQWDIPVIDYRKVSDANDPNFTLRLPVVDQ